MLPLSTEITAVLYKHKSLSFRVRNQDYRYVACAEKIPAQTLLLLERVYTYEKVGDIDNLTKKQFEKMCRNMDAIRYDVKLMVNLYPRVPVANLQTDEIYQILDQKLKSNSFYDYSFKDLFESKEPNFSTYRYNIGLHASCFNHKCDCNVMYEFIRTKECTYMVFFTVKDLEQNEECFTNYGTSGHDAYCYDFTCISPSVKELRTTMASMYMKAFYDSMMYKVVMLSITNYERKHAESLHKHRGLELRDSFVEKMNTEEFKTNLYEYIDK